MNPEDPDSDPNHSQNVITSSFYHFGHILKILSKSVRKFLNDLVQKQTDGQTNPGGTITVGITSLAEVIILLSMGVYGNLKIGQTLNTSYNHMLNLN